MAIPIFCNEFYYELYSSCTRVVWLCPFFATSFITNCIRLVHELYTSIRPPLDRHTDNGPLGGDFLGRHRSHVFLRRGLR